jgi:arylsulfatase A-like enzyme
MEQGVPAHSEAVGSQTAGGDGDDGVSRSGILLMAAWFGLAAGLLELLFLAIRVQISEKGFFLRSRHFVWMVPVSDLAIDLATAGLIICIFQCLGKRAPFRLTVGLFIFLGSISQLLLVRGLYSWASVLFAAGVAVQTSRLVAAHRSRFWSVARKSTPVLLVVLLGLIAAPFVRDGYAQVRRSTSKPIAANGAPNVLLIVLDTVRADHLSLYGYDRDTSPNLARLATEGVRFDLARAAAPWTLPSHASLFTGRWPHQLGVEKIGWLDAAHPTLAEYLSERGYDTAGFIANTFFCGHESGLSRGFETYHDYPVTPLEVLRSSSVGWLASLWASRIRGELEGFLSNDPARTIVLDFARKDAARVNREFLAWVGTGRKAPFFAFLNFFDAHDPYITPYGAGRTESPALSRRDLIMLRDWQKLNKKTLDAAQIALAPRAYDDCIASLDRELGRLIDELNRRGLLERTLLIVTADHGEQFGEHGDFGHGMSLYQSEIHVPLLIVRPGTVPAGKIVGEAVSLRDVPATVVDLIDQAQGAPFPGQSLAWAWREKGADTSQSVSVPLSELEAPIETTFRDPRPAEFLGPTKAIAADGNVYIRHGGGAEEMYNLASDPKEAINLASKEIARMALERLRLILNQLLPR